MMIMRSFGDYRHYATHNRYSLFSLSWHAYCI